MPLRAGSSGSELAADYLRTLLTRPGRYRERWVRRAEKPREGQISQAAVARVIADYILIAEGHDGGEVHLHRRIKDRVFRALSGSHLTSETLKYFMHAFAIGDEDSRQLWACYTGVSPDQVEDVPRLQSPPNGQRLGQLRITFLKETHHVGPEGAPTEHHTELRLIALVDGLSRYPVQWDSEYELVLSCAGTLSDMYRSSLGFYAVDIILPRPLKHGETYEIKYAVVFRSLNPDDQTFRRIAPRRIENVFFEVKFHPDKPPKAVYWAAWMDSQADTPPYLREPMTVEDDGLRVHKELASAERSVVGFSWEWPEETPSPRRQ